MKLASRHVPIAMAAALLSAACSRSARQDAAPRAGSSGPAAAPAPLLCYVGGTMQPAMAEIAAEFEKQTGHKVLIDSADSGELLVRLQQTGKGDLYVAHDPFLGALVKRGLGDRAWTVARLEPVLVVQKGNPKGIAGFRDLARPGLRVIRTDPQYSTAGHIVTRIAAKANVTSGLASNTVSHVRSGGHAANAVAMDTADATVVWNVVAGLRRNQLDPLPIEPELLPQSGVDAITTATFGGIDMDYVRVTIATLKSSKNLDLARQFAFFAASDAMQAVWQRQGYAPPLRSRPHPLMVGPATPPLLVYCAAGMRPPVEKIAQRFEQRHGMKVELTFDGSNRLLGQIKLSHRGDVYVAGDADYVEMARKEGLVGSVATPCRFVPVILVAKGNPLGIRSLSDLTRDGVRIGQGDEKAAAVGRIMPRLLELNSVDAAAWRRNVRLETPTVTEIAMAVKLGTLDAAVVWDSTAAAYLDAAEMVSLDPARSVRPAVQVAELATTANPEAARAFLDLMVSEDGQRILRESGYTVDAAPQSAPASP